MSNEKDRNYWPYVSLSTTERMCSEWLTKERVCADSGKAVHTLCKLAFILDDPSTYSVSALGQCAVSDHELCQ